MKEIYSKVSTNLNFVEREKATRRFWEENSIFEKSISEREGEGAAISLDRLDYAL